MPLRLLYCLLAALGGGLAMANRVSGSTVAAATTNSEPAAFSVLTASTPAVSRAELPENRLAREKSPYLLQHRHNPVDWYAWGEEAFERARKENRPIFLSIGYSTCHWCHVMERESFEDAAVADVLNRHFVSIKVDREERPDVDKIYMTYVQLRTGSGGWPLNVFLTPDLKPFFGGTYWPPTSRYGRPGFREVLTQIAELWKERRGELEEAAREMAENLRVHTESRGGESSSLPGSAVLTNAMAVMKEEYDPRHGGFGGAPKFPRPSQPSFLLRTGRRLGDEAAEKMVLHTCERMAAGGLHDQLGGGFARYSVDAEWLVPHFEKMLYDNAQLVQLYLDAWLASGDERFAEVVRSTIRYVLRDMTHQEGGFYSAEDADSEGHEGKFYCWTQSELGALLSRQEFEVASRYFGITEKGNFEDHSHPSPLPNQNVLSIVEPRLSESESAALNRAKAKLLEVRSKRIRPHLDDKVLTSWNGLMLGALARASAVLGEPAWTAAAERNLAFLREKLWQPPTSPQATGTLHHRWRDGGRDTVQLLDDYAFLLDGVLHLYEATLQPGHLDFAIELGESMLKRFHDPEQGGFWQSAAGATDLILRVKEDYDGAEPSGNSVAALALLRLGAITERKDFRAAAEGAIRRVSERLMKIPQTMPQMLQALEFALDEPLRVVIAGDPAAEKTRALLRAAHSVLRPHKVVLGTVGPVEPFARTLAEHEGKPTAYVCTGTFCRPPTHEANALRKSLE